MIGQKLIKILQSLDPEEFRRLKRALSSPYFATNTRLLTLYEHLKKHYPEFEEEKLQKEKLFKKLYPGKPFNDGVLRVLVREFSAVVEDYILLERLRSDKPLRKKMLVKEYGQRNLYEYFKKGTEELVSGFDDSYVKDMEHYSELIQLYQDYCFHPMTNNYDANDNSLENLMDSLDAYFVLAKYRFAQVLNNKNTIFKKKANYRFFDLVRENEDEIFVENKIIVLYELLNKLHSTNDEKYFLELKEVFFPIINKVRRTDSRIIYFIGLNFCARQINAGKSDYFTEQFEWYFKGLKNDLLIENDKMSDTTFNNIVYAACYKKEFDWAEGFIDEYNRYLDSLVRGDALNYSKAVLNMQKGDFIQALQLYANHNYGVSYHLKVRTGILRSAFEQSLKDPNYFGILQSYIDSYKKYLQRNTIYSDKKILQNKAFIRITEKLAKRILANEKREDVKKWFEKELIKEDRIVSKSWLISKVNDL
ncbi:MAG: hypothetical protein R2825_31070 [Saprospiraceae bacterium]